MQICLTWKRKGPWGWPALSSDLRDQTEKGYGAIYKPEEGREMGRGVEDEGQKDNFVLYHGTYNLPLT